MNEKISEIMLRFADAYRVERAIEQYEPREFSGWCYGYVSASWEHGVINPFEMNGLFWFIRMLTRVGDWLPQEENQCARDFRGWFGFPWV